jgi:DnaK suppressor protein
MMNAAVRVTLTTRLTELEGRAAQIRTDISEPMSADFEEQAVEAEDDEVLLAQDAVMTHKIATVRAAIRRVDDGIYGVCLACGGAISQARLDAIPESALCIACAEADSISH